MQFSRNRLLQLVFLLTPAVLQSSLVAQQPAQYVNPLVGTSGDHGQTFPGAALPFGMVTASPDTFPSALNHDAHAGYNYEDKKIVGFSHFRMSGVGCEGLGEILSILPLQAEPESLDPERYAQAYEKRSETATPGYYAAKLIPSSILAELTVTQHSSLHRYTFPTGAPRFILLDLRRGAQIVDSAAIFRTGPNSFDGNIRTRQMCNGEEWKPGWYQLYFHLEASAPLNIAKLYKNGVPETASGAIGRDIVLELKVTGDQSRMVTLKIGFSEIDCRHAQMHLNDEVKGWNFTAARRDASRSWSNELGRISVDGSSELKKVFYTSLYHSMLLPVSVSNAGGQYRGNDEKVHASEDFGFYSSWTLWDTYRTQMPLVSLLDSRRARDMCLSLAAVFAQRYSEQAVGYWPVPNTRLEGAEQFLLDSMRKGDCQLPEDTYIQVRDALAARLQERRDGLPYEPRHTARTLDDDYAAWAVGEWANMLGRSEEAEKYHKIAADYRALWNPATKFFGAKDKDGKWLPPKDPKVVDDDYLYEGTMWQYRWTVPYDLPGQTTLIGGREGSTELLKTLFNNSLFTIANEPDINYPYLFDYLGEPWLSQFYVHQILLDPMKNIYGSHDFYPIPVIQKAFRATPDGLLPEMDDDGGTMSAWYVFSSVGIYPLTIGEPFYFLTSPIFKRVVLHLSNGKNFEIEVVGNPIRSCYIQSATLNGQKMTRAWLRDEEIRAGGKLLLAVGQSPNRQWGLDPPPF